MAQKIIVRIILLAIIWICVLFMAQAAFAADEPFVFQNGTLNASYRAHMEQTIKEAQNKSPELSGVPPVTELSDSQILMFPVVGGGNGSERLEEKKIGDLRKRISSRVEPDRVHEAAVGIASKFSGDYTIEQICSIYSTLKSGDDILKGWSYVRDPRGKDYYNYANESLNAGAKSNCIGAGDCDDFAILMSSLVESIGGSTRIILARNNTTGGHAFAEVYLGNLSYRHNQIDAIVGWLKDKYDTQEIYSHIDTETNDVWLNLDWGADEKGTAHPGGPFYQGDVHVVVWIDKNSIKTSPGLPEKHNRLPRVIGMDPNNNIHNPETANLGDEINWSVRAIDPDNDPILYRFFIEDEPITRWGPQNWTVWKTTDADIGNNRIEVRIRDGKHAGPDGFDGRRSCNFTVNETGAGQFIPENQTPEIFGLEPDLSSPREAGDVITWTAEAKDADNDSLQYRFLLNDVPISEWMAERAWVWNTSEDNLGYNQIDVQVRDGRHSGPEGFDASRRANFTIREAKKEAGPLPQPLVNETPVIESLSLDKESPQEAGAVITWTAEAHDPENDLLFYRFLLNGRPMTEWTSNNIWIWESTDKDEGTNQIDVQVRDGKHSGSSACDDSAAAKFEIVHENLVPAISELEASPASPQPSGTEVRWLALAEDPEGDDLLYRFLLEGPSTGEETRIVRDWSSDNSWIWKTCQADVGESRIIVQVRDGRHSGSNEGDDIREASFSVESANSPPILEELSSDPSSPQEAGASVVWTASAMDLDGDSILYEFLINDVPVTGWMSRNTWTMRTAEGDDGDYRVAVWVRDGNHAGEDYYDDKQSQNFIIVERKAPSGVAVLGGSKKYSYVPGPAYTDWKPSYTPGPGAYPIGT
ncbi:MAG: hypothetical protein PHQ34_02285 [Methanothrix sp.]|nr:hypothetical protein [Methanothrix sp.]